MSTEGSGDDQRRVVAEVASQLFGATVTAGARHRRDARPRDRRRDPGDRLTRAADRRLGRRRRTTRTWPADPLASWIETTFGLDRRRRRPAGPAPRPTTVQQAAARRWPSRRAPIGWTCAKAMRTTLQAGSRPVTRTPGRPLFAFRLHQFLSKGDTVYVTLEDRERPPHHPRLPGRAVPDRRGKILLPLAFCRECGQEYLVVARHRRRRPCTTWPGATRRAAAGATTPTATCYVSAEHAVAGGRRRRHRATAAARLVAGARRRTASRAS